VPLPGVKQPKMRPKDGRSNSHWGSTPIVKLLADGLAVRVAGWTGLAAWSEALWADAKPTTSGHTARFELRV
jgi:hypothetical protein